MSLSIESFKDFSTYKKDLRKALNNKSKSKYIAVKYIIEGKERVLLVFGKNCDKIILALNENWKKMKLGPSVVYANQGIYENGIFHPVSGKPITSDLLEKLGVSDIASVFSQVVGENDIIPGTDNITLTKIKELVAKAEKILPTVEHKVFKKRFEEKLNDCRSFIKGFALRDYSNVTVYMYLMGVMNNYSAWVHFPKEDLRRWTAIAQKQNPEAYKKLMEIQSFLDNGEVSENTLGIYQDVMKLFKEPKNFEIASTNDPETLGRVDRLASTSKGPGEMYAITKKKVLDAIKASVADKDHDYHDTAKATAKILPSLFKHDLREKLEQVHKGRGQRLEVRKSLIEKALIPLREYLKALDRMKEQLNDSGTHFVDPLYIVLERIHKDLLEDYRSKDISPK